MTNFQINVISDTVCPWVRPAAPYDNHHHHYHYHLYYPIPHHHCHHVSPLSLPLRSLPLCQLPLRSLLLRPLPLRSLPFRSLLFRSLPHRLLPSHFTTITTTPSTTSPFTTAVRYHYHSIHTSQFTTPVHCTRSLPLSLGPVHYHSVYYHYPSPLSLLLLLLPVSSLPCSLPRLLSPSLRPIGTLLTSPASATWVSAASTVPSPCTSEPTLVAPTIRSP